MNQGRDFRTISGAEDDERRSRRMRRLGWALTALAIAGAGALSRLVGWVTSGWEIGGVMAGLLVLVVVWRKWSVRRRERRWRRDGILFEPELPRPISSIPEEYEWQLPSHPWIRVPLMLVLIAVLYWVWVVHGMQLPGSWLVGTVVLALINLWIWSEPLLLVFMVALGVGVLALMGWVINTLPLAGMIGVAVSLTAAIIVLWAKLRKRQSKGSSHP